MVNGKQLVLRNPCREQILQLKEWWSNIAEEAEENNNESIWDAWTFFF